MITQFFSVISRGTCVAFSPTVMRKARRAGAAFVVAAITSLSSLSSVGHAATTFVPTRIDPTVARAIASGFVTPWDASVRGLHPGAAQVVLELFAPADSHALDALEIAGAKLTRIDGAPLSFDRFVPATLDAAALKAIESLPWVRHVGLAPPAGPMALDRSAQIVGLDGARGANRPADEITGQGMLIADADTDVDVFHPKFFRADGGWIDWIDVDGDGTLTPDVDAIDLDGNGNADPTETAHVLRSETLDFGGRKVSARAAGFDPAIDWLYLDLDGNGSRDFGPKNGFDDTTPAFGEPLFAPDDVNRNGAIDLEERVVRLGSSKIRSVYVDLPTPYVSKRVHHVYERGKDLIQLQPAFTDSGIYGYADALHATGVTSILAGDVPLVGRRWVGMAPDADVIIAWNIDQSLAHVTWALGKKPDAMFHEIAPWTGQPLDGSDSYSRMIDTSVTTDKVTHTCPTGDIGGSGKHARAIVAAGATKTIPFSAPKGSTGYAYVEISINVRAVPASSTKPPPNVTVQIVEPSGGKHDVGITADTLSTGASFYPTTSTTSRGTYFLDAAIYTTDKKGSPIPTGSWSIVVTGDASSDATVDAYVSDDVSGFGRGIAFTAPFVLEASTLAYPSTADHCIAIGAEPAHALSEGRWFQGSEPIDGVRDYSPRGPRIDGMIKPDVLAPDNPWSAAPNVKEYPGGATAPPGAVWPFGGTSGSVPHAAGITALMAQIGIRGDAAGDALRKTARVDGITASLPNADWGYGRIDAAAAMGGTFDGKRPSIALRVTPSAPAIGDAISVEPVTTADDGAAIAIEARWDDGYDGTWDTPYAPLAARTIQAEKQGVLRVKLRARNASGRIAEAVARIVVADRPVVEPEATVDGGTNGAAPNGSNGGCGCRQANRSNDVFAATAGGLVLVSVLFERRRRRRSASARA